MKRITRFLTNPLTLDVLCGLLVLAFVGLAYLEYEPDTKLLSFMYGSFSIVTFFLWMAFTFSSGKDDNNDDVYSHPNRLQP